MNESIALKRYAIFSLTLRLAATIALCLGIQWSSAQPGVSQPVITRPQANKFFSQQALCIAFPSSLFAVARRIGGTDAQVTFAGAHDQFVGLDQINARLSRSLAGRGDVEVVLTADGQMSNTVRVNIK